MSDVKPIGDPMNHYLPKSLALTLFGILSIPAIAYGAFHYIYPADPDAVYTQHGNLNME